MNAKNSNQVTVLRPEAREIQPQDLTLSQLRGMRLVVDALDDALTDLGKKSSSESVDDNAPADKDRTSRLVFLTGEPGTGKSSIYVTLRNWLSYREPPDILRELPAEQPPREKSNSEVLTNSNKRGLLEKISNRLKNGNRIVWLEPLDLEPMSGHTNFLAAVLVRVEDALNRLEIDLATKTENGSNDGYLSLGEHAHKCIRELHRLQTDLALSWDSHVRERAQSVEPDVYAAELRRAEIARLGVRQRVKSILEGLADMIAARQHGRVGSNHTPLFVLPIDDFYLDPAVSLGLLRLLRMISVPHLFTVLLGDEDVIEELLRHQLMGDQMRLLGGPEAVGVLGLKDVVQSRSITLAAAALRKLIPPAQRCEIEAPEIMEALYLGTTRRRDQDGKRTLKLDLDEILYCHIREETDRLLRLREVPHVRRERYRNESRRPK